MTNIETAEMSQQKGEATLSFREQGNNEYRSGNYLRAAALYSRGIKEEPGNATLLCNRSAALLQINKYSKALADADECIRLEPEWDKGYFRRACALEALGRLREVSLNSQGRLL